MKGLIVTGTDTGIGKTVFSAALVGALARALAGPARPDHLLIEASGIADPVQLAQLAQAEPLLRLDAVATLVDAAGIRQRLADRWAGATVRRQIGAAGLLVLNKADLVAPEELAALCALLADLAPGAARLATRQGRVAPDLLLGPAGWRSAPGPTGAGHGYRSWSGRAGGAIPPAAMRAFLAALPEWVHRVKGIAPDPAGSAIARLPGRNKSLFAASGASSPNSTRASAPLSPGNSSSLPGFDSNRAAVVKARACGDKPPSTASKLPPCTKWMGTASPPVTKLGCMLYSAGFGIDPPRVCGSFQPSIFDATNVRSTCAVPPPMVNMRTSRAMRSSGRSRE